MRSRFYMNGFLSVDIAFSIIIMSIAFVAILHIQDEITKELSSNDIQKLQHVKDDLLIHIKQNTCTKQQIITNKNQKYETCKFMAKKDFIVLEYIKIM